MSVSLKKSNSYKLITLGLLLATDLGIGLAADSPKPVSVHAVCSDRTSSDVASTLREEIRTSSRYRLVRTLTDEGQMDLVLTIELRCTEHNLTAAIATAYGQAKCYSAKNCHLAIDGSSMHADLCEAATAAECGRAIFRAFDEYVNNPIRPTLPR
jgi:hypothetical protein